MKSKHAKVATRPNQCWNCNHSIRYHQPSENDDHPTRTLKCQKRDGDAEYVTICPCVALRPLLNKMGWKRE